MNARVEVLGDAAELAHRVAGELVAKLAAVQGEGHVPSVALTGGTATLFHRAARTFTPAGPIVATGGSGATAAAVRTATAPQPSSVSPT